MWATSQRYPHSLLRFLIWNSVQFSKFGCSPKSRTRNIRLWALYDTISPNCQFTPRNCIRHNFTERIVYSRVFTPRLDFHRGYRLYSNFTSSARCQTLYSTSGLVTPDGDAPSFSPWKGDVLTNHRRWCDNALVCYLSVTYQYAGLPFHIRLWRP